MGADKGKKMARRVKYPEGIVSIPARNAYRAGYRAGLRGFATMYGGRQKDAFWAGYATGFAEAGHTEAKPFETRRSDLIHQCSICKRIKVGKAWVAQAVADEAKHLVTVTMCADCQVVVLKVTSSTRRG